MLQITIILLTVINSFTSPDSNNANDIVGMWLNPEKNTKLQIYKSGDKYMGKIIWLKEPYLADGKTLKKDKSGTKTILNLILLSNFVFDSDEWVDGSIYDPTSGKNYSGKITIEGNILKLKGYIGSPLLGKTVNWTKAQ
ncbi:DUF2147 domain-containing protein [Emticicia sp. C21]|uniref:DUF2147 domain-containing protein n=1 Tax=Emticicia sp. C21 TaxID=2302915 RepID=UPI000E9675A6|nr:DUF2147 domain-containing protein [Emticicia sp. C21]RFS16937.1 DUF2147 domain-containing protein [Emticicia sp. C21]